MFIHKTMLFQNPFTFLLRDVVLEIFFLENFHSKSLLAWNVNTNTSTLGYTQKII